MKTYWFGISLTGALLLMSPSARAAEESSAAELAGWETDFAAASARAREDGRAIVLNFTGSDWCGWCHKLRDEVFTQAPFVTFAESKLVLVEVDFPRNKKQSAALVAQNRQLDERFNVSGYPTIVVLNSAGVEIGRLGYIQGGVKTFVRELQRMIAADMRKRADGPS